MCKQDMVVVIDNFRGVYLLSSINEKYKGQNYIGFTVNPERRIKQHNAGKAKGGARKTNNKRPWKMVLIVHGFMSKIAALQFEWAWQNPQYSLRMKHLPFVQKRRGEKNFDYKVRILSQMLNIPPWYRKSLTVRWLHQDYSIELDPVPPEHMPIAYGPVRANQNKHQLSDDSDADDQANEQNDLYSSDESDCQDEALSSEAPKENVCEDLKDNKKSNKGVVVISSKTSSSESDDDYCPSLMDRIRNKTAQRLTSLLPEKRRRSPTPPSIHKLTAKHIKRVSPSQKNPKKNISSEPCILCNKVVGEFKLTCLNKSCRAISHSDCLSQKFLEQNGESEKFWVPVSGCCPRCCNRYLWTDLIRKYQGFETRTL